MARCSSFISSKTNKLFLIAFQKFGEQIYKRPCLFITIGLILTAIAGSGILFTEMESSLVKLWVPQSSTVYKDYILQKSTFGSSPMNLLIILQGYNGQNIFTEEALTQAYDAMNTISNITTEYSNTLYTFHDLCARIDITSTECVSDNSNLHSMFFASQQSVWSDPQYIDSALNNEQITYFAGSLQYDGDTVSGANVIRISYQLAATSDDDLKTILLEYESAFLTYWGEHSADYSQFDITYFTPSAFDNELSRTVMQDSILFAIAFGVMLVYLQLTLGGLSCIRARVLLATSSIFILVCALLFGFGISAYLGNKFSTLVFVVPFLLLGVGVDDMIIIVDTLNHTKVPDDNEEFRAAQLGLALQHSGVSITLTSFCSIVAFFAGTITDLPGLEYFCYYAAFSFLGNYILQFLLFVPLLVYDNKRIRANRNFCCPCFEHRSEHNNDDDDAQYESQDDAHTSVCSLKWILDHSLIVLLSSMLGRICIIILFVLLTVTSAYFASKVESISDPTLLVPDDSFLKDFYDVYYPAWPGSEPHQIDMVFIDVDFSDFATRNNVYSLMNKVENLSVSLGEVENWLEPFTTYVQDTKGVDIDSIDDKSTFYGYLKDFEEESDYNHWADELIFDNDDDPTEITATRFYFYALEKHDNFERYASYVSYNELMDEVMGADSRSFFFDGNWIYSYFNYVLKDYTYRNLAFSLSAVLVILLFLMDIRLAIFILFVIVGIDVCLFGWMYMLGIDLQIVSFCQLCMAVGLTVDYVIHMVHAIADLKLDNDDNVYAKRVSVAMHETGGSVIKGAVTTFVGSCVLAFSGSIAFRSFFWMLAGIIIVASLFGLLVAPALMGQLPFLYSGIADLHSESEQENQIYQHVSLVSASEQSH